MQEKKKTSFDLKYLHSIQTKPNNNIPIQVNGRTKVHTFNLSPLGFKINKHDKKVIIVNNELQ